MPIPLNSYFLLWIIGIWQPVSPEELTKIICDRFNDYFEAPNESNVFRICRSYAKEGLLVRVHRKPSIYSLSLKGQETLPKKLRQSRDKNRLLLLRDANRASLRGSHDDVIKGLDDATSFMENWFRAKRSEARSFASVVPTGQTFWPRFYEQFLKTGYSTSSCDILYPVFFSYYRLEQLPVAKGIGQNNPKYLDALLIDEKNLGLMIGISYELISSTIKHKHHYYRSFTISKKDGGDRKIDGPRVFLKIIQRFLLDYYLSSLKVHPSVKSFIKSKSVISNACLHKGKTFVGTIDIENFFGSICTDLVLKLLKDNGYKDSEAKLISELCTYKDVLPQGAPTSPILSNALLYEFDKKMDFSTKEQDLTYTRYADDITISGDRKDNVKEAIQGAKLLLKEWYSLNINLKKTRIVSFNNRQVVTGLVVNEKVQPPRYKRHQIRAAFHNASLQKTITEDELNKLRGYYGYLSSIPALKGSQSLIKYKAILEKLNRTPRKNPTSPKTEA